MWGQVRWQRAGRPRQARSEAAGAAPRPAPAHLLRAGAGSERTAAAAVRRREGAACSLARAVPAAAAGGKKGNGRSRGAAALRGRRGEPPPLGGGTRLGLFSLPPLRPSPRPPGATGSAVAQFWARGAAGAAPASGGARAAVAGGRRGRGQPRPRREAAEALPAGGT